MEFHSFHNTPGYIQREIPIMDHIRRSWKEGEETKWGDHSSLVMPPKLPEQEEVELFADGLAETAQQKMVEMLDRHDFLEHRRINNIKVIQSVSDAKNWDEFTEYFYTYFENSQYAEVLHIHRWLKYWRRIYEMASKSKFEQVFFEAKSEITEDDIARAKEVPLAELFDGDLKHSFGKFVGLCPFHGDSTPSFTIFENDNHYYCFGCNAWGDAIDYYMKTNHVSMIEAVKRLNER